MYSIFHISSFKHSRNTRQVGTVLILKVEYRGQNDGAVIGTKTFLNDNGVLQSYLEDGMRWWKDEREREARGVCMEEAFKSEFAEDYGWRKNKIEEQEQAAGAGA